MEWMTYFRSFAKTLYQFCGTFNLKVYKDRKVKYIISYIFCLFKKTHTEKHLKELEDILIGGRKCV